jgi:hypothetical protein
MFPSSETLAKPRSRSLPDVVRYMPPAEVVLVPAWGNTGMLFMSSHGRRLKVEGLKNGSVLYSHHEGLYKATSDLRGGDAINLQFLSQRS